MSAQPQNSSPAFRPDLVRRPEMAMRRAEAGAANQAVSVDNMRKLIVGPDIALNGEISACDYLVVEGTVEAKVKDGRRLEIAEGGLFRGTVEIDEAEIAGRFEGELTVRGRLNVRGTGRIDGKVQYGELAVEAGGHIEGELRGVKATPAPAMPMKPRVTGMADMLPPETAAAVG